MAISIIDSKNLNLFSEVIPDYIQGEFATGSFYGLGLIEQLDGKDFAAGAVCFFVKENLCQLEWLYIIDAFRGKCLSDELMNALYDFCSDLDVDKFSCLIPDDEAHAEVLSYLFENNFNVVDSDYKHTYLDKEFIEKVFKFPTAKTTTAVVNPNYLKTSTLKTYLETIISRSTIGNSRFFSVNELLSQLDTDVSSVILNENGDISACLLVRIITDSVLEVIHFKTLDQTRAQDNLALISKSIRAFEAKYNSETTVHLILNDDKKIKLSKMIFDGIFLESLIELTYKI